MDLYTIDEGGITRNIGRDSGSKLHISTLKESRTNRDWIWFCTALWRKKDEFEYQYDNAIPINLVDTIILKGGKPFSWYYTGTDGKVARKNEANVTLAKVIKAFVKTSNAFHSEFVGVVRYSDHYEVVPKDQIDNYKTGFPYPATCVQSFLPSHGRSTLPLCSDFSVEYRLETDGSSLCIVTKLGNVTGMTDSKNLQVTREKIRSLDSETNAMLEQTAKDIVMTVEKGRTVRMISCVMEFTLCDDRTIWLITAENIITTRTRPGLGKTAPTDINRLDRVRDERFSTHLLPEQPDLLLLNTRGKAKLRELDGYHGPTHMRQRFGTEKGLHYRERNTLLSPINKDDISPPNNQEKNERLTQSMTELPSVQRSVSLNMTPARVTRDLPERTTTAAAIGSSQLNGCSGDFCDIPIESYTKHESGILEELNGTPQQKGVFRINYKWIIQAREEKDLVRDMISRMENHENGEYISYDAFHKHNLGLDRTFPVQYYKDVDVCSNCYKMYNKIEQERQICIKRYQVMTKEEKDELELTEAYKDLQSSKLGLTKNDILEFRRFSHPPQAVVMVSTALLLLLTGNTYNWDEIRKLIANSDRILTLILLFDPDSIEENVMYALAPYIQNPNFRPAVLRTCTQSASKFCKFVIDNSRYISRRLGIYHEVFPVEGSNVEDPYGTSFPDINNPTQKESSYTEFPNESNESYKSSLSFADKVKLKRKEKPLIPPPADPDTIKKTKQRAISPTGIAFGSTTESSFTQNQGTSSPSRKQSPTRPSTMSESRMRSVSKDSSSTLPRRPAPKAETQQQRFERLANPIGSTYINRDGIKTTKITEETQKFVCDDGTTTIPYQIIGEADENLTVPALIIINDFFDTFERMQIVFNSLPNEFYGCQILVFNYPGQSNTKFGDKKGAPKLSNQYIASILNQLLQFLNQSCDFITNIRPFMVCGIGNGANIGALWISTYGEEDSFTNTLRSFIIINGFSYLDPQLTAILHSSVNVFSCFPPNRRDLPISYFSRFIFSEDYLTRVNSALALKLYTAVTNNITNNGRVQICEGTLNGIDLRPLLPTITCPFIIIQSTDDALVNPSHIDSFIEGRSVHHVWSHEATDRVVINSSNHKKLTVYQHSPKTAYVVWLKSGHEILQECKEQVLQVFQNIYRESPDAVGEDELNPVVEESDERFKQSMQSHTTVVNEEAKQIKDEIRKENPTSTNDDIFRINERNRKTKELRDLDDHLRKVQETQMERRKKWDKEDKKTMDNLTKQLAEARNQQSLHPSGDNRLAVLQLEAKLAEERARRAEKDSEAARDSAELAVSALRALLTNSTMGEVEPLANAESFAAQHKDIPPSKLPQLYLTEAKQIEDADKIPVIGQDQYTEVVHSLEVDEQKKKRVDKKTQYIYLLQRWVRGCLCRKRLVRQKQNEVLNKKQNENVVKIQALSRGYLARNTTKIMLKNEEFLRIKGESIRTIQRVIRGFLGRRKAKKFRQVLASRQIQKVFRGHLGRLRAKEIKRRKALLENENYCATKIQTHFRSFNARRNFRSLLTLKVAATTIQRVYRGHRGRLRSARIKKWESAAPGPERLKLGLQMIEETKEAFERQRQEIDALHRAQEKAELKVSEINSNLKESEGELVQLEAELKDVDKLENEVEELSHEQTLMKKKLLQSGGTVKTAKNKLSPEDQAKEHDLLMALEFKKAERDRKKKALEAEFAGIFAEIGKKKEYLETFEAKIADMEANRQRKEREFKRLQRNLMELLSEQKRELDAIREKGIELEVATAQSAAAASATATKAKEHEKKTEAVFNNTEELMKFQFMSMGLTYFSAMNMLQGLRDMNTDTTSSAISASAETAVAAAAAAAAANIPTMKKLDLGAEELLSAVEEREKIKAAERKKQLEVDKKNQSEPFPFDVNFWSVDDVSRWLKTLSLSQYIKAFREACVDGEFLMELTPDDLKDVLGVEHALHIKKIIFSREKLRTTIGRIESIKSTSTEMRLSENITGTYQPSQPQSSTVYPVDLPAHMSQSISQTELLDLNNTHCDTPPIEEETDFTGIIEKDQVFNWCSHGRVKKVQEAIEHGFDVNTPNSDGNTLLIVACQQVLKPMVSCLVDSKCDIDYKNRQGNTALHFAMTYDPTGSLGEILMSAGASDMIENTYGMTPYDGLAPPTE